MNHQSLLKQTLTWTAGMVLAMSLAACGGGSTTDTGNTTTGSTGGNNNPPAGSGNVTVSLSWDHGAAVGSAEYARIRGYYVYYGRTSGNLTNRVDVGMQTNAALAGADFGYNGPGQYLFQVVAYGDTVNSIPSPERTITIQ